jgi:hypothetical protein
MLFGYIHTDKSEQAKVLQVMKMLSEPTAIDELGIGRIRDAFSNMLFPGTSSLQKHVKYFSLMPQLYKKATEKKYSRLSEVSSEIVRLERIMTKNLWEGSTVKTGITGSERIDKGGSYVKYDPAYIYNSGLLTFGILHSSHVNEMIFETSKNLNKQPDRYKSREDDEDTNSDEKGGKGLYQFCSFPQVKYDFSKACSLKLTPEDKAFIVDHILTSDACRGSLLRFIIEHEELHFANFGFEDIDESDLPVKLAELHRCACLFADFIHIVHLRYNWIYSKYSDTDMLDRFKKELSAWENKGVGIDQILNAVTIKENSSKHFCHEAEDLMLKGDLDGLDAAIKSRERRVKGNRRKIDNPAYCYDKRNPIHNYKLDYRWPTIRTYALELQGKEVDNG